MIVDCHSHIWPSRGELGRAQDFSCMAGSDIEQALPEEHLLASDPADAVLVLGFVSRALDAHIPNAEIKQYVAAYAGRLLGFAGIDPTERGCLDTLRRCRDEDGFVGLTVSPACQDFHPSDSRAMRLYEAAEELAMPVYFLQGDVLPAAANLSFTHPDGLDEVARTFGGLKMVISHMGYPWIEQTIALLAKHDHVYADVAGLTDRPWQAYRTLTLAYEYGVIEKILFASDFPSHTVKSAVEALYNLNKLTLDSVLPAIPREQLRGIVERESLGLLGLTAPTRSAAAAPREA